MKPDTHLLLGRTRGDALGLSGDVVLKHKRQDGQTFVKIYQREPQWPVSKHLFRAWDAIVGNTNVSKLIEQRVDPTTIFATKTALGRELQNTRTELRNVSRDAGRIMTRDADDVIAKIKAIDPGIHLTQTAIALDQPPSFVDSLKHFFSRLSGRGQPEA